MSKTAILPASGTVSAEQDNASQQLRDHNRRVVRWAEQFDRKFHDTVLVLGWAGDKDGLTPRRRSRKSLVALSAEHARKGRIDKPLTEITLRRHLAELEALGAITVMRSKQGFSDKRRGAQAANAYLPNYAVVIRNGQAEPWEGFWAPLEDDYSPRDEPRKRVTEPRDEPRMSPCLALSSPSTKIKDREPSLKPDPFDGPPLLLAPRIQHPASQKQDGSQVVAAAIPAHWPSDSPLRGHARAACGYWVPRGFTPRDVVTVIDSEDIAWHRIANPHGFIRSDKFAGPLAEVRRARLRAWVSEVSRRLEHEAANLAPAAARMLAEKCVGRVVAAYKRAGEELSPEARFTLTYWLTDVAPAVERMKEF
ncbi:MAG: hypothetical protein JO345_34545 [Streptosporangiaceae bacterium]|nr:hypothetical protein [Streptosporangiaceae bacterium]